MNLKSTFKTLLILAALPAVGWAQYTTTRVRADDNEVGPRAGNIEIGLGGNGGSDQDFDSHFGGGMASFGFFFSDTLEGIVRQGINYGDSDASGSVWNGSTFVAADWHLAPRGAIRPFVGVNVGAIYGETTSDTWAAGLEGGLKFYVRPKTFIAATVQYEWLFDKTRNIDNTFDDGSFIWSIGIGFNL